MEISNKSKKSLNPKYENLLYWGGALFFVLFGIIFILGNHSAEVKYNTLLEDGQYTYGKITDVTYYSGNHKNRGSYSISGTYTVYEQVYSIYFSSGNRMTEGSIVKVLYDAENPSNYVLEKDSFTLEYIFGIIFLIIGILACIFAYKVTAPPKDFDIIRPYNAIPVQSENTTHFDNPRDVWHYDITNPEKNKQPYRGKNNYTKNKSTRVNIGTTAFYNRKKR
ncbi:MAG: hypothetical protein UHK60_01695 [Acutalibacteraceae bacterium]|nr:hypothetical protein [Acutalibacteraceae bacterium]